MEFLDKAADFIKNCKEKTTLVYDVDGDSIGSAVIVAKTIERLFNYIPSSFIINHDTFAVDRELYREISSEKIKNVIIVDISVDEEPEYILKISKKARVLVIDHHQIRKNLNKIGILYINPNLWDSKIASFRYCTSKLTYDICSRIINIKDLTWLAGLGIINDYCGEQWKDFLDSIYEKYPILKKGNEPYSFDSNLGLINHMITSGYYHSGAKGGKTAYEACLEATSPLDLLESKTTKAIILRKYFNEVQKELKEITENWRDYAEINEDKRVVFLELKTKFAIQSPVSTMISIKNPSYTLIVFKRKGNLICVSLRRNDGKINCGKLAEDATKGLENANGGGHKPASGAHIMASDLEKFKEKILNLS